MITIIADPHAYQAKPTNALYAQNQDDYVPIRSAIRRALYHGETLTVYVTHQLVVHWLSDLSYYDGIQWEYIEPEADYRRLFGTEPTPPFTADVLIALNIANMNAPPQGRSVDPVGWALGERLDPIWNTEQGSRAHLSRLLGWILYQSAPIATYLHPMMQQCLTLWSHDYSAYSALQAGSLVRDAINLVRRAALQRYDRGWLHQQGLIEFPIVDLVLDSKLWINALSDLAQTIESYWREQIAQIIVNTGFIQEIIQCMSGWSNAELHTIHRLLRNNSALLDVSLIQTLQRRFTALPEAAAIIDELATFVPPARPVFPEQAWSDDQWLRWATNEYMPYFSWVVRSQQPRKYQQECALAYEMWLAQRYPDWLVGISSPLITRQFTYLRDLMNAQPNTVVIWLVVDGMTWWQGRIFREICQHQGLYPQRYESGVALLPSITDLSKRALVTGMAITEAPHNSIAQAAREKLERVGVHCHVGYNAREAIEALQGTEPPQCVLWFANMLDRLAHERADFPDTTMVRGYMEELGQNLARMRSSCIERGLHFHVLVGSDHGSTLLPSETPTRRLPQATREVIDVWEDTSDQQTVGLASARAVVVSDTQRLQIDQPNDWHHLGRIPYQLPFDYLIPRGYAAIGRRPMGWTHGGLTPEETIVPLMHLTPQPLTIQQLSLTISGQIRTQQDGSLIVQLVNPNPAPLDQVVIRITDIGLIAIDRIAATGRYETTIMFTARAIIGIELPLEWILECSVLGIEYRQQGEVRIAVRRLQTENSFDDLFG